MFYLRMGGNSYSHILRAGDLPQPPRQAMLSDEVLGLRDVIFVEHMEVSIAMEDPQNGWIMLNLYEFIVKTPI